MNYVNQELHPYIQPEELSGELVTEVGQAYTPRQILQQFVNQDIHVRAKTPTDFYDDTNTTEDALFENVIESEDQFDLRENLRLLREEKPSKVVQQKESTNEETDAASAASEDVDDVG